MTTATTVLPAKSGYPVQVVRRAREHREAGWSLGKIPDLLEQEFGVRPTKSVIHTWTDPRQHLRALHARQQRRALRRRLVPHHTPEAKLKRMWTLHAAGVPAASIGRTMWVDYGDFLSARQVRKALAEWKYPHRGIVLRVPYVGEGAAGARRSAEIDRQRAAALPDGHPHRAERLRSAERWEAQAAELERQEAAAAPAGGEPRQDYGPDPQSRGNVTANVDGTSYGPSQAALKAAEDAYLKAHPGTTISTTPVTLLRIAHDPRALGLDASIARRAVHEWAERKHDPDPLPDSFQLGYNTALIELREWLANGR